MLHEFEAIFENGVLRPLSPLPFTEREQVTIHVTRESDDEWLDDEFYHTLDSSDGSAPTLAEVRRALSGIKGSMDDAIDQDRGEY